MSKWFNSPAPVDLLVGQDQEYADDVFVMLKENDCLPDWDQIWLLANNAGEMYMTSTPPRLAVKDATDQFTLLEIFETKWGFVTNFIHPCPPHCRHHPTLQMAIIGTLHPVILKEWWTRLNMQEVTDGVPNQVTEDPGNSAVA